MRDEIGAVTRMPVNKFMSFPYSSMVHFKLIAYTEGIFKRSTAAVKDHIRIQPSCINLKLVYIYACSCMFRLTDCKRVFGSEGKKTNRPNYNIQVDMTNI